MRLNPQGFSRFTNASRGGKEDGRSSSEKLLERRRLLFSSLSFDLKSLETVLDRKDPLRGLVGGVLSTSSFPEDVAEEEEAEEDISGDFRPSGSSNSLIAKGGREYP